MTDETARPEPATDSTAPTEPTEPSDTTEPAPSRTRLRDRSLGIRGVAAVAVAGLVLGGLGGTAIGFAADDGSGDRGPTRFGRPFPGDQGHRVPDGDFAPPGAPEQAPPSTAPDEETQPDGSTDSSSSTDS
jgi:hypothetical protein